MWEGRVGMQGQQVQLQLHEHPNPKPEEVGRLERGGCDTTSYLLAYWKEGPASLNLMPCLHSLPSDILQGVGACKHRGLTTPGTLLHCFCSRRCTACVIRSTAFVLDAMLTSASRLPLTPCQAPSCLHTCVHAGAKAAVHEPAPQPFRPQRGAAESQR